MFGWFRGLFASSSTPKIDVPLLPGWVDESSPNPRGVLTYFRAKSRSGPFQVSWNATRGNAAEVSEEKLQEMTVQFGEQQFGCGKAKSRSSGRCPFGSFGRAFFSLPPERCHEEVWILSNGRGFLMVTYISANQPDTAELAEARKMATKVTLKE